MKKPKSLQYSAVGSELQAGIRRRFSTLLDGLDGTGGVYLEEERTINLPHSGEVLLAIISVPR